MPLKHNEPKLKSVKRKTANTAAGENTSEPVKETSNEDLIVENLSAMSHVIKSMTETLDVLIQKTESMAYHIIATEEVLAELVAENGLDLVLVNERIRDRFAVETGVNSNADRSIDVAASIASPQPRK